MRSLMGTAPSLSICAPVFVGFSETTTGAAAGTTLNLFMRSFRGTGLSSLSPGASPAAPRCKDTAADAGAGGEPGTTLILLMRSFNGSTPSVSIFSAAVTTGAAVGASLSIFTRSFSGTTDSVSTAAALAPAVSTISRA